MKKKIYKNLDYLSLSILDGPIDQVIERISNLKKEYQGENLVLDLEYTYDGVDIYLYDVREETDLEYETRLKEEELKNILNLERQKKKAENERKKYEELKKKYEKETNP